MGCSAQEWYRLLQLSPASGPHKCLVKCRKSRGRIIVIHVRSVGAVSRRCDDREIESIVFVPGGLVFIFVDMFSRRCVRFALRSLAVAKSDPASCCMLYCRSLRLAVVHPAVAIITSASDVLSRAYMCMLYFDPAGL